MTFVQQMGKQGLDGIPAMVQLRVIAMPTEMLSEPVELVDIDNHQLIDS